MNSSSTYGSTRSNSMDPFIIKELPEIEVKHSVGGLNMHQAEEYWRVIHRSNYDLDTLKGGHVMDAKEGQQKLEFTSIKRTPSQVNVGGPRGDGEEKEQELSPARAATAPTSKKIKNDSEEPMKTATRMLKRMARDTAPDVQLDDLIPLQLSHGKMTVGDRDLLEAGLKAEGEGIMTQPLCCTSEQVCTQISHNCRKCSLRRYTILWANLCMPWTIWTMLSVLLTP